jgi:type IV pilus assembly protein PilW
MHLGFRADQVAAGQQPVLTRKFDGPPAWLPQRTRSGFSIFELLVSTAIGLGLLLLISTLYLASNASFRLNNEHMRLQQDGSYAMNLMAHHLRQAGFGRLILDDPYADTGQITDFVPVEGTLALGLHGCDNGYVRPLGSRRNFSCSRNPGMASFAVSYRVDDIHDAATGLGADCNGAQPIATAVPPEHPAYQLAPQVMIARNRFFVGAGVGNTVNSLYCHGNGNIGALFLRSRSNMSIVTAMPYWQRTASCGRCSHR